MKIKSQVQSGRSKRVKVDGLSKRGRSWAEVSKDTSGLESNRTVQDDSERSFEQKWTVMGESRQSFDLKWTVPWY